MDRRGTLKKLMLASGGLVTLPTWAHGWTLSEVEGTYEFLGTAEEKTLSIVVDTILPADEDGVGAISEGVDQFLMKLLDRCYEKDVQDNVLRQLVNLDLEANNKYGLGFEYCDELQRTAVLNMFGTSEDEDQKAFFDLMKKETIRGFQTSRKVMTRYYRYRVAPGYYHGCVDVETE